MARLIKRKPDQDASSEAVDAVIAQLSRDGERRYCVAKAGDVDYFFAYVMAVEKPPGGVLLYVPGGTLRPDDLRAV